MKCNVCVGQGCPACRPEQQLQQKDKTLVQKLYDIRSEMLRQGTMTQLQELIYELEGKS